MLRLLLIWLPSPLSIAGGAALSYNQSPLFELNPNQFLRRRALYESKAFYLIPKLIEAISSFILLVKLQITVIR